MPVRYRSPLVSCARPASGLGSSSGLSGLFARAVHSALLSSIAFVGCTNGPQQGQGAAAPTTVVDMQPAQAGSSAVIAGSQSTSPMAGSWSAPMAGSGAPEPTTPPMIAPTIEPPAPAREPAVSIPCSGGRLLLAENLTLDRAVDYVADRIGATVISERGVACESASDVAACQAALAAAKSSARNLLTIEGDTVRIWDGSAALELFGSFDTAEDAVYRLLADGRYDVPCSSAVYPDPEGFQVEGAIMPGNCGIMTQRQTILVEPDGTMRLVKSEDRPTSCTVDGRRPEGLRSAHVARGRSALGEHFAQMAHAEAASVPAFAVIADELVRYRAPRRLVAQARRALADEQRHARIAARLALRFGVRPSAPIVERRPPRSLEAFALDNAVEGCVNETYAALRASYQAVRARDPQIAAALGAIAADETRHASFAFALARWVHPQLNRAAQRRVARARRAAVERLSATELGHEQHELQDVAGLPDAAVAGRLLASLRSELWDA